MMAKWQSLGETEAWLEEGVVPEKQPHGIQTPLIALLQNAREGVRGQPPGEGVREIDTFPAPADEFVGGGKILHQIPGGKTADFH